MKAIIPVWIRAVLSSSWRSIHCSTKNTKMAFRTTWSDAVFAKACDEATTPARIQTNEPKYQAGAGGAFRRRAAAQDQEDRRDTKMASLRSNALPAR